MTQPSAPYGAQPDPSAQPWAAPGYGVPGSQAPGPYPGAQPWAAPAVPAPPAGAWGQPVAPLPYKDATAAWLFWFFLGSVGAHHFYLGRTKWGVWYAVGFVVSLVLTAIFIGVLGLLALFVLWIVDATKMNERLQQHNARAFAVNRSLGVA